ncbi:hypothetical protein GDO81_019673 [Engystomops pustulosus]|uniref:DUF4455 domain-containing protein n=1 Tax=Engystomops pustulosus TaxID=76066 RepID=A0AAV6YSF5_ENGPU|nr:hypothetical protein GDO81_019673 [Engystomops pustulosus]
MEALVMAAGMSLQEKICESDGKTDLLFQKYEERSNNINFTVTALNDLWDEVVQESRSRRQYIGDTEKTLLEVEERRTQRIAEVLRKFTALLKDICFLMPSDVHRFIHKEAMMINQAMLANHRAIAKLSLNLMEAELKREGSQRLRWQDLVKAWKSQQKEMIIEEFREILEGERDGISGRIKTETDLLMDVYKPLNDKRLQLLCSVSDLVPPTCTKTAVIEWYDSLQALNKQIDHIGSQFLEKLRNVQDEVIHRCMREAEKSQESLQAVSRKMDAHINRLFRLAKKSVHLWESLQTGLSGQEETLQKLLDSCRQRHNAENQAKEADLDIILDTLRQESTAEQLRVVLGKAEAALHDIESG